jgi:hypothetical protein
LRDSAGFTPDFAGSTPTGICARPPEDSRAGGKLARLASQLLAGPVLLDGTSVTCQSRVVKSCGPSGSQDLAFKGSQPAATEQERAGTDALATFRESGFGYFLEQAHAAADGRLLPARFTRRPGRPG